MEYKTIIEHIGEKYIECNCGYKNEFDVTGHKIPFYDISEINNGILEKMEDGFVRYGYPIWASLDCEGCGCYIGWAFINHLQVKFE